jgi:quercetin dioxygenase-like cupin family protein
MAVTQLLAATLAAVSALAAPPSPPPSPPAAPPPLIQEALPLDPKLTVRMEVADFPPTPPDRPLTTAPLRGHSHPAATYVYVVSGAVLSRLGSGSERKYAAGEAWREAPGEAHYIVNADRQAPARLLIVFVYDPTVGSLTQPLPPK